MNEKKKHRVIIGIEVVLLCMIIATLSINATSSNPPSNGVSYNKNNQTTVQNALDDLYNKANYGNATASQILKGRTALVGGKQVTGTYVAPTLASQTPGNATKENIDKGKIAWVNGEKIVGTGSKGMGIADIFLLGAYVKYTPSKESYSISSSDTGYEKDQTINPNELNLWRVIRVNEDGTVELVSSNVSSKKIYITGVTAYKNYIGTLNKIAASYETEGYTIGSRHIGYDATKIEEYLSANPESPFEEHYTGEVDEKLVKRAIGTLNADPVGDSSSDSFLYWFSSRNGTSVRGGDLEVLAVCSNRRGMTSEFQRPCIFNDGTYDRLDSKGNIEHYGTNFKESPYRPRGCYGIGVYTGISSEGFYISSARIRPIVVLKPDLKITGGNGTEDKPWTIAP